MTPTEFFKEYTNYKIWIGSLDEYSAGKHNYKGYFNTIGVEDKWTYIFPKQSKNEIWVCILYVGSFVSRSDYEVHGDRWRKMSKSNHSGWTYWYVQAKEKPSFDDAIDTLIRFLQNYDNDFSLEGYVDHLNKMKTAFAFDLNKLDLDTEKIKLRYSSFMRNHIGELICGESWYGNESITGNTIWSKSMHSYEEFIKNYDFYVQY